MMIYRHFLKLISFAATFFSPKKNQIFILTYHRVTGDTAYEFDIHHFNFLKQIKWLYQNNKKVISLEAALKLLRSENELFETYYVLTFDDAYSDFVTIALPVILKYKFPVTIYVPTDFIDNPEALPVSSKLSDFRRLNPLSWTDLVNISSNPLITIGSHSKSHSELTKLSSDDIEVEINISNMKINNRLGLAVKHFAYPRGIFDERVEALLKNKYESIVLAGGGGVNSSNFLSYRIPRIPILRSDGMFWFKARIEGRLIYEEMAVKAIKKFIRRFMK